MGFIFESAINHFEELICKFYFNENGMIANPYLLNFHSFKH
ncbi:hypothetical protein RAH41_17420 [Gottfriedia acidiceleris]